MVPRSELAEAADKARATADRLRARARKAEGLLADAAEQAAETADAARAGVRALLVRADSLARAIADATAEEAKARAAEAARTAQIAQKEEQMRAMSLQAGGFRFVKRVSAVC